MEDNKLKREISIILHSKTAPAQLYSLIEDVVLRFNEYDFEQYLAVTNETENYCEEYYQSTKPTDRFQYFIKNIYQNE